MEFKSWLLLRRKMKILIVVELVSSQFPRVSISMPFNLPTICERCFVTSISSSYVTISMFGPLKIVCANLGTVFCLLICPLNAYALTIPLLEKSFGCTMIYFNLSAHKIKTSVAIFSAFLQMMQLLLVAADLHICGY